jgi:uncharacterized protein YcfL
MKKLIILICLSFFFISCSSNNKESVIQDSTKIINEYVDTLEWSIQDSKKVKKIIENNQDKLLQELNSIK